MWHFVWIFKISLLWKIWKLVIFVRLYLFFYSSDCGPSLFSFSWYQQLLLRIEDILKKDYYSSAFNPFWKHIWDNWKCIRIKIYILREYMWKIDFFIELQCNWKSQCLKTCLLWISLEVYMNFWITAEIPIKFRSLIVPLERKLFCAGLDGNRNLEIRLCH